MIMVFWSLGGGRPNPPAQPARPPASWSSGPPAC